MKKLIGLKTGDKKKGRGGGGSRKFIGLDNKRKIRLVTKKKKKGGGGWIKKVYMTRQQKKSKTGDKTIKKFIRETGDKKKKWGGDPLDFLICEDLTYFCIYQNICKKI